MVLDTVKGFGVNGIHLKRDIIDMKECLKMIKSMDKEFLHGLQGTTMLEVL
jgi:hypothetical protein